MKLHDLDLSGNAYKVRLFLSLIGPECVKTPPVNPCYNFQESHRKGCP